MNNFSARIFTGLAGFVSVLGVMLSAALIARRMRWSSMTKRFTIAG
jgi:hypothetical protein